MSKIKYAVKENKKLGTHSFYAVPVVNGSLSFDEVVNEACNNTSIEPSFMAAAVKEYMKAVQRNVQKGFRVPVGESFLFVYPNIRVSAKDYTDKKTGQLVVATADMVSARAAESRLGCTVATKFSQEFAANVQWQRIDATGAAVDEPDDVTDDENAQTGGDTSGNQGGGENTPSGDLEG